MVRGRKKITGVYSTREELGREVASMRGINMSWAAISNRAGACIETCKAAHAEHEKANPKSDWRPGTPWTEAHRAKMKGKCGPKKGTLVKKRAEQPEKRSGWLNVTLDPEAVNNLTRVADQVEAELGFRPTVSQTIRYAITKAFG